MFENIAGKVGEEDYLIYALFALQKFGCNCYL